MLRSFEFAALGLLAVGTFGASTVQAPGAPRGPVGPPTADPTWWAYRALERPAVPDVRGTDWVRNPVDAFVLARLEARGLEPSAPADDVALLRRATYDLTGLPPTPDDVAAYVADRSPDKFERLVDRLLASPQYGVKWGRHWLDLVRFAETDSYERDRLKPGAWRYRDWVVDAFNADMPYDRFVTEQLAGDEVDEPTLQTIVATGYYRLGIWDDEPTDTMQAVYDDLDTIVDTTCRVMLGISMGCARCHDHKKDPIPQRDYYRMLAFFEGIAPYKVGGGNSTTPRNFLDKVPADLGKSVYPQQLESWRRERDELVAQAQNLATEAWSRASADAREAAAAEREAGLVEHLSFDDGAAVATATDGAEDGASFVDGRIGRALAIENKKGAFAIDRPVQDDFTIAFWFKTARPGRGSASDLRWFLGSGLVDAEVPGIVDDFGISFVADHVCAGVGRPETFVHSPGGLADDAWHHVAFTRHRESGRVALYVDGTKVDDATGGKQALTTCDVVTIGRMQPGRGVFRGALDDVRFYDRELDPTQVLDLYFGGGFASTTSATVAAHVGEPEAARYDQAVDRLRTLTRPTRELVQVLCVKEVAKTPPSFVRERGNVHATGEPVTPGYPAIVGGGDAALPEYDTERKTSRRRLTLAQWITDPDNPLTSRVLVNRIWQHHFGRGLSRETNDFGQLGTKPTHPALLDWLARELVENGWSLKAMHRLLMTSSAYRMSSAPDAVKNDVDPLNDLFWRFDMRRLTAEEIRDSILAATGELNLELGGPGVYPPMPKEVLATSSRPDQAWRKSPPDQANRRSLYIHLKRSLLTPLLVTFDMADTDTTCPVRFVTTQPQQALTMLNSTFIGERARAFAARLRADAGSLTERIRHGWFLLTARRATDEQVREGEELVAALQRNDGMNADQALDALCLVLLNLNEFVYLD